MSENLKLASNNTFRNISQGNRSKGFTLTEILLVIFIVGAISVSFTRMFIFGVQGSHDNTEHVMAYNLAREKLEEVKGIPFEHLKSDYILFRDVYQDRSKFDDSYYNEDSFILNFSDVFTQSSLSDSENQTTYNKLKELYPKGYLKPLVMYPDAYSKMRRVTKVSEISNSAAPAKLKKVTVYVYGMKNKKIAELSTFIGKYK